MITANVIQRTFQLRFHNQLGTCFTVDVDGKQYLCTAKHCLKNFHGESIELFHEGKWKNLEVRFVGFGLEDTDISVLAPKIQLSPSYPLPPTAADLIFGQDVYFLGFPYGLQIEVRELNRLFPLPLVKRAAISSFYGEKQKNILLDGHNNPGFSGGPVVFTKGGRPEGELRVAAVISGYRFESESVFAKEGKETLLRVRTNTGIILSYDIKHALDAIRENPIGSEIQAQ